MKTKKKWSVIVAVLLVVTMLAGCGETVKKEFKAENETFSIQMDETWSAESMGDDGILAIFSKDETRGIIVAQFPKNMGYSDMETVKDSVETTFTMNSVTAAEAPASIPGLENLSADMSGIVLEGQSEECYTVYGESEYAYYSFIYIAKKVSDKKVGQFQEVCASFVETAPEIEDNSQVAVTDTIRWFNATCAVLTSSNGWDYNIFGGLPANDDSKAIEVELLDEWWGVTDRASADENMDWLLTEGHRASFAADVASVPEQIPGIEEVPAADRITWIMENYDAAQEDAEAVVYWYNLYEEQGDKVLSAWDYSRAMSLLGYYYLAGYYTETEALDKSLEVAGTIQSTFTSWDEFMESYFTGYEYWSDEDSSDRRALYEEIKAASDSPYSLDFGMTLEKSW
ncbi:DUF1266 domain-containing protein [Lachnospiraceae bacterium JLR.KK008]